MTRTPVHLDPPGAILREELEERGWTQTELAELMNRPIAAVNEIINGKRKITQRTAAQLEAALGIEAGFWLRLELEYQQSLNPRAPTQNEMAKLMTFAPIKEMQRRGWIPKTKDATSLTQSVLAFFGCETLDSPPALAAAFRQSAEGLSQSHFAWSAQALRKARAQKVGRFNASQYEALRTDLHDLAAHAEGIRKVPRVLSSYGIRYVVVKHLKSTKIDGATLWLDRYSRSQPVIAMSLRYGRIDNFWFTLCHEASHVYHRDAFRIDIDLESQTFGDADDEVEERANEEAAATLIPPHEIESFILRKQPYFSAKSIIQFSNRIGVHPGIVVGQLRFRKAIKHTHSTKMLVQIRDIITETAVSDGWVV